MTRSLRFAIALVVLLAAAAGAATAAQARTHARPKHPKPPKPAPVPESPFAWRGVVEGFYGTPWSHGERTRVLTWMGAHGFNAYVHAPKGDALQTTGWRQPYPASTQANFDKEIALARDLGVQWIPNVSPARGNVDSPTRLCFSCPSDVDAMLAKLRPFLDAGSETVMVSFDDIRPLLGPTDSAVYGARYPGTAPEYQFGRATADFLNALLMRLPVGTRLLTVLPDYSGTVDTPYLQGTREGALNAAIGVMWTGPNIRASDFTAADAAAYAQLIGRDPIVWENWVARDFVPSRMFLGPFSKRKDVTDSVGGFFFNPANEPDVNMLPLATAGAWMQDPDGYRPRPAWTAAIKELSRNVQPLRGQLRAWAETNYSSGIRREEAPTEVKLQNQLLTALDRGARWTDAAGALRAELNLVMQAPKGLRKLRNRHFAAEAKPFLDTARQAARSGRDGLDLLTAERPALTLRDTGTGFTGTALPPDPDAAATLREKLEANWTITRAAPVYVYGCRERVRGCGTRTYNRMDDFLTKVTALDAAWAPTAEQAARRRDLVLTAHDEPVRVHGDGTYTLPSGTCGGRLLAVDGAGGETSLPLPACPRKPKKQRPGTRGA